MLRIKKEVVFLHFINFVLISNLLSKWYNNTQKLILFYL